MNPNNPAPDETPPGELLFPVLEPAPPAPQLENAITAQPSPVALPAEPLASRTADPVSSGLWNWVVPCLFFMSAFLLVLYATPYMIFHWRLLDAQADAEAFFHKRRAELRVEAEHADGRLDVLDKRAQLISLGFREVARKVAPKVVNIAHYREPKEEKLDALAKKILIYDPDNERRYILIASGSGLIVQPGVILTNYHVVRGAQRLRVSFASGQSIGVDPDAVVMDAITDLAVIRLPEKLPARVKEEAHNSVEFADSDKDVHVGDWALAIGSPLGYRWTVTQGIISAKGRLLPLLDLVELLQTDAAMNPGNSGGPLFDQLGRVIGINVAIASDNGVNQGIGFAIPSNTAKKITEQLLTSGEVPRGYLGIAMEELPAPQAKKLKLEDGGVIVKSVIKAEAAANAGIQTGDIIVRINQDTLNRVEPIRHFRQLVVELEPGRAITIEILRDGVRRQLTLTVGKRPANLP